MVGRLWTKGELQALAEIEAEKGPITYQLPFDLETVFEEKTGRRRKAGTIYMANWRRHNGRYSHLLTSPEGTGSSAGA